MINLAAGSPRRHTAILSSGGIPTRSALGLVALFMLFGCATSPAPVVNVATPRPPAQQSTPVPVVVQPTVVPTPPPAPPPLVEFDAAILNAATLLFKTASANVSGSRKIVIDPLVESAAGQQTIASRKIEARLREIARESYPNLIVDDFNPSNVAQSPLVLVGTVTGITLDNKPSGKPEAYRIWLALADLSTNKIVAKGIARAIPSGVDTTPTAYFSDSPVWVKDDAVEAYIKTCQLTKLGDTLDPAYRERIETAAIVSAAIVTYEQGKFKDALTLYQQAERSAAGNQLRVHSGLYLTQWKLGRKAEAERAFGGVVDHGLAVNKLAVKLLFKPGRADFWGDAKVSAPYPIWLRQIAQRISKSDRCVQVVGHTSASGSAEANDKISLDRAQMIKARLEATSRSLVTRVRAVGMGSRENVIGSGSDDLSDLQDRRVEFKIAACVK
jgi:flagellar motor protein MotB